MDKPSVHDNMHFMAQLKLAQITTALRLKKSTVNYVAKRADRLADMPPEAAPGKTRTFRLDQAARFGAAVMLVRGGVPLDSAGPVLSLVEGVVDEANKIEDQTDPVFRYSIGRRIVSDPWLLTITNDNVGEIWRKRLKKLIEDGHGHLENMTHSFDVATCQLAGDSDTEIELWKLVINLTEIENQLIAKAK